MTKPTLHIVGNGSVGLTIAALAASNNEVYVYGRLGPLTGRIEVKTPDGVKTCELQAYPATQKIGGTVVFALKAFDLDKVVPPFLKRVQSGTQCLILSNGDVTDLIGKFIHLDGSIVWYQGVCLFGAARTSATTVTLHTAKPRIRYARLTGIGLDQLKPDCEIFEASQDIERDIQLKLYANLVMNTMTAAFELKRNIDVRLHIKEFDQLSRECFALMEERYDILLTFSYDEARIYLEWIVENMAENLNSMAADVMNGRPTESAFLSGLATDESKYPLLIKLHKKIVGEAP